MGHETDGGGQPEENQIRAHLPRNLVVHPCATLYDAGMALKRRLGLWSATAVLIGSTIGSGIFRTPAGVAARLPGPLPLLLVWVTGGLFALCGALTLAEVAGAMPATGGPYVFIREAWGRLAAFVFGWSELLIIRAASLGALSTTFAEYLFRLIDQITGRPIGPHPIHGVAALAIATTAAFNYIGLGFSSAVQNITTLAKYGGLVLIVLVACAVGFSSGGAQHFVPAVPPGSLSPAALVSPWSPSCGRSTAGPTCRSSPA